MVRLGDRGGSVRIGHCRNAAFALELCTALRRRFPGAGVKSYPLRGLCSNYAEHGGIMLGFASCIRRSRTGRRCCILRYAF